LIADGTTFRQWKRRSLIDGDIRGTVLRAAGGSAKYCAPSPTGNYERSTPRAGHQ
jgi:hypothetical protein